MRLATRILPPRLCLLALGGWTSLSAAQSLSVSGSPAPLQVSTAFAGAPPNLVVDAATSYSVTSAAASAQKITACLDAPMPTGVTLEVTLAAPAGAITRGTIALDALPREVVAGIPPGTTALGQRITWQLSATVHAGVVAPGTRTVTFTLVDAP